MNRDQYSAKLQWHQNVFSPAKRLPDETKKRESSTVGNIDADLLPVRVGCEGSAPIESIPEVSVAPRPH